MKTDWLVDYWLMIGYRLFTSIQLREQYVITISHCEPVYHNMSLPKCISQIEAYFLAILSTTSLNVAKVTAVQERSQVK